MNGERNAQAVQTGQRIVAARRRKGMSQMRLAEELSQRSGVDADSIRRSLVNNETGRNAPRFRTLQAIAEITEQPLEFFTGGREDAGTAPFRDAA